MSKGKMTPKEIYKIFKNNEQKYNEETHCEMIIKCISEKGTISAFCKEAMISDSSFYRWTRIHPIFESCYRYATMVAREAWEEEGRYGKDDPDFNMDYWKTIGSHRFGLGKSNRVRVDVDSEANPYLQYQQLLRQASHGDFTAAEVKQLMESVNVGSRVFESFKLQQEVDAMKDDLSKMSQNHAHNIIPIAQAS